MSNERRQLSFLEPPAPPLAGKARDALRTGDFKQAIDLFKRLVKQEPCPEYSDGLADAYAGRAKTLAAKGLFEEAEAALRKAASPDGTLRDPLLHVQCLCKRGQLRDATVLAVKYIGNEQVPAATAAPLAELAAALWLVAPVPLPTPADQKSEAGKWVEQAAFAQQSLIAWIEGQPPEAIDQLLGRIPLRSAFRALRLILKSLLTAADDPVRARQLLYSIAPGSPFASFRLAVEAALPEAPGEAAAAKSGPASKAQQVFAVEVKGLSNATAQALLHFTKAERSGPGALLAFLAGQVSTLPADEVKRACFNLLPQATDRLRLFESTFGPLSAFENNRVQALGAEAKSDWPRAERYWTTAARSLEAATGAEAKLSAGVIYRHLADLAREHPEIEGQLDSEFPEIEYLDRSLQADPDHLPAVMRLIGLYRKEGLQREWQRLAEDAAQRFPSDSAVLLQAIEAAMAKKATKKAVGFARKLLTLDPINQAARQRMIELHISHARKQNRSKRPDLACKELAEAATWERASAPSFLLRINQGLIGREFGEADAEAGLRQGVELAGGGVAGWFRASLEHALMQAGEANAALLREELARAQRQQAPTKAAVQAIVSALNGEEVRDSKKVVQGLIVKMRGWLSKASGLAWSAAEFHPIAELFERVNGYDLLADYAKAAKRREPDDATWRYYQLVARVEGDPLRLSYAETNEMVSIETAAADRNDYHMANRIRRFVEGPERKFLEGRGSKRGSRTSLLDVEDDDEPLDLVSQLLAAMLEDTPPDLVNGLIKKHGRSRAVKSRSRATIENLFPRHPAGGARRFQPSSPQRRGSSIPEAVAI